MAIVVTDWNHQSAGKFLCVSFRAAGDPTSHDQDFFNGFAQKWHQRDARLCL